MFFSNTLNSRLKKGGVVFGSIVQAPCCAGVEILGLSGFDFAVFDCEHGPLTIETIEMLIRACHATGLAPLVRMPMSSRADILRVLDCGAAGVQIPHISSREDAATAVGMVRYYPVGDRGLNPYVRANSFGSCNVKEYMDRSNQDVTLAISLEGSKAAQNADDILSVKGVDVVFLGPYDLSQSLGVPGQSTHPSVLNLMEALVKKIKKAGKHAGVFADRMENARRWLKLGVQYVVYSVDTKLYLDAAQKIVSDLHVECPREICCNTMET